MKDKLKALAEAMQTTIPDKETCNEKPSARPLLAAGQQWKTVKVE